MIKGDKGLTWIGEKGPKRDQISKWSKVSNELEHQIYLILRRQRTLIMFVCMCVSDWNNEVLSNKHLKSYQQMPKAFAHAPCISN